ncbi:MAG: signal peptide peptidase SppA [Candidatus Iainarchaeum archaeon]|uniref:Signal peptide peptidase SppA n=1 Tax=Candidatus Iainarchaeum sp. TaxID=3101447 RepID=A0A7T9I2B3_9ARCH|nr:MAG: signal peptide peptidase SppA [Candidatus Diapherotrites archaeon]
MASSSQKAPSQNHPAGVDPHITPWEEESHLKQRRAQGPAAGGRSLKDWLVLAAGVMLGIYVLSFLVIGTSDSTASPFVFGSGGVVSIIPIKGEISTTATESSVGYLDVIASLKEAQDDPTTKAILLDIDSPGGSVVSTKQIVDYIQSSVDKPIVSWIGEVGASGAYYVAASTDYIMADNDSITGSIGVRSEVLNVTGLLEKIGVKIEDINAGKFKNIGSPYKDLTEEERAMLQEIVDQTYGHFKRDVILFRREKGLDLVKFETYSDGRIITGWHAFDAKMIDAVGSRREAILKAAELGGIIGEPETQTIAQEHFSLRSLFFSAGKDLGQGFASGVQEPQTNANGAVTQGIQAR